jgi:hypothetical protein
MAPARCVALGAAILAPVVVLAAAACTPGRTDQQPTRTSTPAVTAPAMPATCTPQQAESLLGAFVQDYNAGRDVVGTYFAGPDRFERWWDPTLPPGQDLGGETEYQGLLPHLRSLHDQGIRLALTNFSGRPNSINGIGFVFGIRRVPTAATPPGPMTGKGVLDCATSRFTVLVIDWWGS